MHGTLGHSGGGSTAKCPNSGVGSLSATLNVGPRARVHGSRHMRSRLASLRLVVLVGVLAAGCGRTGLIYPGDASVPDLSFDGARPDLGHDGGTCRTDGDCDDGVYCDGTERCSGGTCVDGTPVACTDRVDCTV